MHYIKVALGVVFGLAVFLMLDYALPSVNTVRITNTYNKITHISSLNSIFYASENTGTAENAGGDRDIRFIDTVRPNGDVFVYRNEDTGWVWPPYFKYDSSNLHSEATNLKSDRGNPEWVAITAYGWRIPWLSTYPNAVSIKVVSGPGDQPLNWAALVILVFLALLVGLFWRMWRQFNSRTIAPAAARVDAAFDRIDAQADRAVERVRDEVGEAQGRFKGWMDTWKGKPRM